MTSIEALLQAETERLGFPLYGVAPASPPPHYSTYQAWIQAGRHAEMAYLATERAQERRAAPRAILPGARSLVVVGMRYPNPSAAPEALRSEPSGRVAAYAWGADYHDIIPPRLEQIGQALEKHLGRAVHAIHYTDTGPVLERDFAQTAGLGWIGKNTCLIDPRSGSYYLLGETLLDVEIEPATPLQSDHCGSCTRCIQACPTSAIRTDRTIESSRCIAYLTIENKGPIPPTLRPQIGDWVFGCDICQMVCPWNLRFASQSGGEGLHPRVQVARPALLEELELTPQAFNQKFRRSPLQRARRRGYLRNVAVALGNAGDLAAAPALARLLRSEPEPLIRAHAAWALGQLRSALSRFELEKAMTNEPVPAVVDEIHQALDRET